MTKFPNLPNRQSKAGEGLPEEAKLRREGVPNLGTRKMSLRDATVIDRRYNCTALNGTRPLARARAF